MYPVFDQIRAPLERVLLVGFGYAAAKGWISESWVQHLVALMLAILAAGYGVYTAQPSVIAERAAAALPEGSKVITTQEIADATPGSPNVISKDEVRVVQK